MADVANINGYDVKDAQARQNIQAITINNSIEFLNISSHIENVGIASISGRVINNVLDMNLNINFTHPYTFTAGNPLSLPFTFDVTIPPFDFSKSGVVPCFRRADLTPLTYLIGHPNASQSFTISINGSTTKPTTTADTYSASIIIPLKLHK